MASESLLKDCQIAIDKGHESWKSYFSKWEQFAKCEENIPESELFDESMKKVKSKKNTIKDGRKQQSSQTKRNIILKKNPKNRKKLNKKKLISSGSKQQIITDSINENSYEKLERILKTFFTEFLKANKNDFQMFAVMSKTYSNLNNSQFLQTSSVSSEQSELTPIRSVQSRSMFPERNSMRNLQMNQNLLHGDQHKELESISQVLNKTFPSYRSNHEEQSTLSANGRSTLTQTPETTLELKNCNSLPLQRFSPKDIKLKSLKWDSSLKSPSSVCRKINKKYFIKRNFLKMNITQDGKRFRNLCLHKRTNSVTLSMENSNFTTPERKPPERKCFSENVLQGKTRRPSKLFFGNEEDSESDDQTVTHPPVIHCKNKEIKIQIISESDSDDCESIFDRVQIIKK